jgi:oxygen-independent coproporphyrinogen-3 oxidase
VLALYLHIPFCLSKCRYCAFNSRPLPAGSAGGALVHDYLDSLGREMQLAAKNQTSDVRPQTSVIEGIGFANANKNPTSDVLRPTTELGSVYFGGGTPTILDPSCLCSLLSLSKRCFQWDEAIEITVEANPATVTRPGLAELRRAGVNRLSLGAQSFDALELQLLGRAHGVPDIYTACRDAREAGFTNLSLDLIYGLPGQSVDAWRESLQRALDLRPEHLSAYGLKLETGTPLAEEVAAGRLPECGEEEQVAMWYETQRLTSTAGLERYEISNYARHGRESRHNLAYWLNRPYLGLGAGASGMRCERREARSGIHTSQLVRYSNYEDTDSYIASVDGGELPRAWEELQTPEQERADTVMMGLRLTAGLNRKDFEARFGQPFEFFYGEQLADMVRDGLIGEGGEAVFLTERGLLLSNYVLAEFI